MNTEIEMPNNLEGPPPTPEERAAMARELDAVAPTPGDKFRLMFGKRPTPRTGEWHGKCHSYHKNSKGRTLMEEAQLIERELAEARALLAAANKGAERNAEALRISSQKLNEARAWSFRLRVDLAESRGQLDRLVVALRSLRDCIQETRGREAREAVEQADDILTELEGGAR
jgi:hypothetical protein